MMSNRTLLIIVLFFIFSILLVTRMDFLSYTFKSIFYSFSFTALLILGLLRLYKYLNK